MIRKVKNSEQYHALTEKATYIFLRKALSVCLCVYECIHSVQSFSRVWLFVTPWSAAHQISLSNTNSRMLFILMSIDQWCHPTITSSVVLFSSCLQSFPASGSFQMGQFFESGSQSIAISASVSVLPKNIQDWFPLGWTGWISLLPKGLPRVFSNTTVQKHQFFSTQRSLICCLGWS